ncbi:MAG TPA: MFS transporter [Acidimicrobiales bacterium]
MRSTAAPQGATTARPAAADRPAPAPDPRRWWALAFLALAQLATALHVTVMNIALPSAQTDLGFSDPSRQWVVTAYALTFGGLLLLGGRVSDLFGRRRTLLAGLVGFAVAASIGGSAASAAMLVTARALQGVCAALIAPSSLGLLSLTFSHGAERSRAFAVLGAVMGTGAGIGLVTGGILTDALSWRWCLYSNVPLTAVAAAGVLRTIPPRTTPLQTVPPAPPRAGPSGPRSRIDVPGAVLITGALAGLVLGLDRAAHAGWAAGSTRSALAVGALLLAGFVAVERRAAAPLLPLEIVIDRSRGSAYLAVLTSGIGMFAGFFFLTFYLQSVRGYTPIRTGFAFLPFSIAIMGTVRVVASTVSRVPIRSFLGVGLLAISAALATLVRLTPTSPYLTDVLPAFLLLGIGVGAVMTPANDAATRDAGTHTGVAGAAVTTHQQVGAALGTALLSAIAASATSGVGLGATVHGYNVASAWGAALVLLGAVLVVLVAGPAPKTPPEDPGDAEGPDDADDPAHRRRHPPPSATPDAAAPLPRAGAA